MTQKSPMRLCILLLLLTLLSQASQAFPKIPKNAEVEHVSDLGFGFRAVTLLIPTSWEIGHFGFLYHQDQILCDLGKCSVAPSGDYAVFQEGSTGNLFLYRRADGRRAKLTSRFIALVREFEWHEDIDNVEVHFRNGASKIYSAGPEANWSWFF